MNLTHLLTIALTLLLTACDSPPREEPTRRGQAQDGANSGYSGGNNGDGGN
jgi:hypothetical protein